MANITNLITAELGMSQGPRISGDQNAFFDKLYSTVKVDTLFNDSTNTYFNCKTLRVWTRESNSFNGDYTITPLPDTLVYPERSNIDLRSYKWIKYENETVSGSTKQVQYVIKYVNEDDCWKLVKEVNNNGTVTETVISTCTERSSDTYGNYKRPISGNYSNISGKNYFPLIVWSNNEFVGYKVLVKFPKTEYGYYGFTPFMNQYTSLVVDWGDGALEHYDSVNYSGKCIHHHYTTGGTISGNDVYFEINILCDCNHIVFGEYIPYYDVSSNMIYWNEVYYAGEYDPNKMYISNEYVYYSSYYFRPNCESSWMKVIFKGAFYPYSARYDLNDIVTDSNSTNRKYYICIQSQVSTPSSGPPNSEYWREVNFRNSYDYEYATYNIDDLIIYNEEYYTCIKDNTHNVTPGTDGVQGHIPDTYESNEYWIFVNFYSSWSPGDSASSNTIVGYNGKTYLLLMPEDYENYAGRVVLTNWDYEKIGSLTNSDYMFNNCTSFGTVKDNTRNYGDVTYFPNTITSAYKMFYTCNNANATFADLEDLPSSLVTADYMFYECRNAVFGEVKLIPNNVSTAKYMFYNCRAATFSTLTSTGIGVILGDYMFYYNNKATFANVASMSTVLTNGNHMFYYCEKAVFSPDIVAKSATILPATLTNGNNMFYRVGRTAGTGACNLTITALPAALENAGSMFSNSRVKHDISTMTITPEPSNN